MTECPLVNQTTFPSPERESVWGYASRHAHLSFKSKQALNRLVALLSSHLESQLLTSCTSFSPAFLLSICDVLQLDSTAEPDDISALPFVLAKLRDWRLLDPDYRYSSAGVHKLALDLAGIAGKAYPLTSSDSNRTSRGRFRMKWVGLDPPSENLGGEPSQSTLSSSPSSFGALKSAQTCTHVLADCNGCRADAVHESCLVGRLGTPDSEDSSSVGSRSSHAVSGFRSGCSACRHPRVSGASTPPSPLMTSIGRRTPFRDVNQFEAYVSTSVVSSRHPKATGQRATPKKSKKETDKSLQSTPRGTYPDENIPPLANRADMRGVGVGISFPCQRAHLPRVLNSSSREPAATCAQQCVEPSRLPNRTREGDRHMSSHRATSTSVDLVLPIARPAHSPRHASPIDLHRQPNRAQSLSSTSVRSHAVGSVARNPKLSSNAVSRSGKLLPFWSETHRRDSATTTTTRSVVLKADVSSASPAKAHSQHALSRPWIPSRFLSDARGVSPCPAFMSSHAHRHTQSAGSVLPSPRLVARRWQV